MAFTFQDSTDTLTEDFEELKSLVTSYVGIDMESWREQIKKGEFPIYEIHEGLFYDECDNKDEWSHWSSVLIDETDKTVLTLAYCSEEFGKAHGMYIDIYADPKEYLS